MPGMPRGTQNAGRMAVWAAAAVFTVVAVPSAVADRNPGVPGDLAATNRSDTTVTLSWSAPAGGAATYEVGGNDGTTTTTQQRSTTVSRLDCGKRYGFDVRALDARGRRSDA